jgi:hypothetical protein
MTSKNWVLIIGRVERLLGACPVVIGAESIFLFFLIN